MNIDDLIQECVDEFFSIQPERLNFVWLFSNSSLQKRGQENQ